MGLFNYLNVMELSFDFSDKEPETVVTTIEKEQNFVVNEDGKLDIETKLIITHCWIST